MSNPNTTDGTGQLLIALYGSEKDNIDRALGGSDAQILYDAANRIKELESKIRSKNSFEISIPNMPEEIAKSHNLNPSIRVKKAMQEYANYKLQAVADEVEDIYTGHTSDEISKAKEGMKKIFEEILNKHIKNE